MVPSRPPTPVRLQPRTRQQVTIFKFSFCQTLWAKTWLPLQVLIGPSKCLSFSLISLRPSRRWAGDGRGPVSMISADL